MKLKTLKDLYDCENGKEAKHICIGCDEGVRCDIAPIKAEAIKWVKEDLDAIENGSVYITPEQMVKRWMNRFNITEEEIK